MLEKVLEDISFEADCYKGQKVAVTEQKVHAALDDLIEDTDTARYIL